MSDIETITRANFNQFIAILRKALPGVELPSNVVDLMINEMMGKEKTGRVNDMTFIRPTIDDVNNKLHGTALKLLPFMPDAIDYMMGEAEGRCPVIEYEHGLFLPCCKKCADDNKFCKSHMDKPAYFGTYADRIAQWDSTKAGTLAFEAPYGKEGKTKMYTEVTYGEYLVNKAELDIEEAKRIIKNDAKLMVRLNERDLKIRAKVKKATGRPSSKKVVSLDGEDSDDSNGPAAEDPKPVKRTRLTDEERAERAKKLEEEKKAKAIIRAEKAEAAKIAKIAKLKADAEALERGEKVTKPKPKPKAKNPVKEPEPVAVDPREKFEGNVDDLKSNEIQYAVNDKEETFYLDPETSKVYNTDLYKVGVLTTDDDGDDEVVFDKPLGSKI